MGVVLVHEEFSAHETWPLGCARCGHLWQEEYLVRHLTDGHGHDVVLWLRSGVMVQPPWSGASCPACGHDGVRAFPPSTHPRVTAAPPPVAFPTVSPVTSSGTGLGLTPVPATEPGLSAAEPRPRRRVSQPALLYALLAIAFVLFTSFEVFEYVVTHH
ncbi:hypothetical protein OG339_12695 [Streptosporangium sp. NBC_01495]|uniref:hypothetical protein n=1 Tax=Streptosporangium sp. NBC_01495 TaxID=2903899 RepID=UPI002E32EFDA|nr:hypothetical protein [Streptosporangium sp. NBC_01495]